MLIENIYIKDVLIITPKVHKDNRGYFLETWRKDLFKTHNLPDFVQDNHAFSLEAGVFRGLHYQKGKMAQAKLVWVSRGSVLDIVVDIRKDSATYGKSFSLVLSGDNFKRLFIPHGFAHGYLTLEEKTDFHYKVDNYYSAVDEGGISVNSKDLGINLAEYYNGELILSDKDKNLPFFENFISPF